MEALFCGVNYMAADKRKHLVAGFWIAFVVGVIFTPLWGLITSCIVGALKEIIWDWLLKKGTPELLDFVATCLGGAGGLVVVFLCGGWAIFLTANL